MSFTFANAPAIPTFNSIGLGVTLQICNKKTIGGDNIRADLKITPKASSLSVYDEVGVISPLPSLSNNASFTVPSKSLEPALISLYFVAKQPELLYFKVVLSNSFSGLLKVFRLLFHSFSAQ